ncbi:hypothetical protein DL764_010179 [Monosporascus ibericus]|uniref:Uncharacterized protein n=1 Tax=Monosporascus ibericus TaxID=155417 RepID=A0A4Q4ST64_9PEZI|nr:hypothetical protein DL764_010179 [Monosporascus ibericus]
MLTNLANVLTSGLNATGDAVKLRPYNQGFRLRWQQQVCSLGLADINGDRKGEGEKAYYECLYGHIVPTDLGFQARVGASKVVGRLELGSAHRVVQQAPVRGRVTEGVRAPGHVVDAHDAVVDAIEHEGSQQRELSLGAHLPARELVRRSAASAASRATSSAYAHAFSHAAEASSSCSRACSSSPARC